MKILTILNRKAPYFHALPVVNILYGIQAANYIVIVGIAKPSGIGETGEPAMLERRWRKLKIKNKRLCYYTKYVYSIKAVLRC